MTGFGSSTQVFHGSRGSLEISIDIKTVNSKFVDISIRSPRCYMDFDPEIQKFIRERLKRGRVDVNVNLKMLKGQAREISVNMEQAQVLMSSYKKVAEELKMTAPITLSDLLKFPDWINTEDASIDVEEEWNFVKRCLEVSLSEVISSRLQEGRALDQVIRDHRARFGEIFLKITERHDGLQDQLKSRIRERVKQIHGAEGFDPQRLEQEIVLWVARSDFQEELDRIAQHLKTYDELLSNGGELGRKLEFLVQELHREVNTLGSKCPDATVTPLIIELKTHLERIREQIQNIE